MNNQNLPENPNPGNFRLALYCAVIVFVTAIAFSPCLKNGFTNWDDDVYVTENPDIRGFGAHNLAKIFSSSFGYYHPLTMLTYMAEYRFFHLDPAGYHCTSVLLHCINAILVFALIFGLSGNAAAGLCTGLLFAVHPLRVESVAWIAERKDVLSSLFYLLSLLAYLAYVKKGRRRSYWLSLLWLLFSLLSKPMAVSQPLVLLLIDYLNNKKPLWASLREKAPFFALAAACAILAYFTQKSTGALSEYPSLMQRAFVPFYGIVFYLVKTIAPVHLSALYPFPSKHDGAATLRMLLSSLPVIGMAAGVYATRKFTRKAVFGSLFFLVTILPVLQMVTIGSFIVAERYTYIPMIGVYFLIAEGFLFLLEKTAGSARAARGALLIGMAAFITMCACKTYQRCAVWRDSFSLWNDVLAQFPNTFIAYGNRGDALDSRGEVDSALSDYAKAIELNPKYFAAYNNRGRAYGRKKGLHAAAIADFNTAIRLGGQDPDLPAVYVNRGVEYESLGAYGAALADFDTSIALNPDFDHVYYTRGLAYMYLKRIDEAIADFSKAIALDPAFAQAYNNRGVACGMKGRYAQALGDFNKAIELNPGDRGAQDNLNYIMAFLKSRGGQSNERPQGKVLRR